MNKFKILGFLIAMISISLFTNTDSQANAAEIEEELDSNVTFDSKGAFYNTKFTI